MEAAILILALLFVAFVALGVFVTVKVVGAAKRGVERTVTQARRTVEETSLRARSYGQGGVVGELAQLRLSLRTSMRATQDALQAGAGEDASLSESISLFQRLSVHGHELDDELKRLEREPDRATVASLLPGLRERTERIVHSAESLRWAARDRARKFAEDDLDALSTQIDMEAGALRHWSVEDPSTGEPVTGQSGSRDDAWPDAGGQAGPGQTWPEVDTTGQAGSAAAADSAQAPSPSAAQSRQQGQQDQPQAITARDPRQQNTYPWQKTARPETTN
ncbi:hypothetical protein ABZY19_10545 [Streptomyces sp. NPDC006475]|uniref:hypothetical protein n=1 Tax=unclassified Streptomyces TaxID=2593676 RepID=UPI0033AD1297|nr:hypothetical protein OG317_12820 [Streptomyces sp. NBC_01167]